MAKETRAESFSRRSFLKGLGGGAIGTVVLAGAATPERNYIGAHTTWVDIGEGTRAFVTMPQQGQAPFRAVILGHERYGLVQHTLDLAAKFAAFGYICVAPDMASHWKGDKAALNRGEARLTLTPDQTKFYMGKGLDYLLAQPQVDKARVAAMGVCQSGEYPLRLNSARKEVAANLIFYGGANTGEDVIAAVTAPILGVFGESDHSISLDAVHKLRANLEKHRKSYEFKVFAEMPHGWLNDTMPGRYRQEQAEAAWAMMIDFLNRVYAGAYPSGRVRSRFDADISLDYDFKKNVRFE